MAAGRLAVIPVVLALLLTVPAVAADWLQVGHDAARTGAADGDGLAWDDMAAQVRLIGPGTAFPGFNQFLFIDNGHVDVVVSVTDALSTSATLTWFRITPADGMVETRVQVPGYEIQNAAMDDRLLILVGNTQLGGGRLLGDVRAYDRDTGTLVWDVPAPLPRCSQMPGGGACPNTSDAVGGAGMLCGAAAIQDGRFYVACVTGIYSQPMLAFALNTTDGATAWVWTHELDPLATGLEPPHATDSCALSNGLSAVPPTSPSLTAAGVSRVGKLLLVTAYEDDEPPVVGPSLSAQPGGAEIFALDPATGASLWTTGRPPQSYAYQAANQAGTAFNAPPLPTGDGERTFVELNNIYSVPAGTVDWCSPDIESQTLGTPLLQGRRGTGMAFAGGHLFAAGLTTIWRFDEHLAAERSYTLGPGEVWAGDEWQPGGGGLGWANGTVYARSRPSDARQGRNTLWAFDSDLQPLWKHRFDHGVQFASSGGLVAVLDGFDGTFTLLGRTAASPTVRVGSVDAYPFPGDLVTVDLSGSTGGLGTGIQSYWVDWGDGTVLPESANPIVSHRYAQANDAVARFHVRDSANRTASVTRTFYVGREDTSLNFLQRALLPQHQNETFFVVGLLVTALAAFFGFVIRGRKRRRLHRELRALEAVHARLADDPQALQTELGARRKYAQQLFLTHKLDDGHFQILEKRIDELTGRARLSRVEEECGFLPLTLAKSLEGMLRDGRITNRERTTFLHALDGQAGLTQAQRAKVRGLMDEWFARDKAAP